MTHINGVESVSVLPNRLAVAEFSPTEIDRIMGNGTQDRGIQVESFNWIAAYLCEEVGIYEEEVTDWFKSEARGLGGKTPLQVWPCKDGFSKVFEYAKRYKAQVEEDMAGEPVDDERFTRCRELANNALAVIGRGFEISGTDTTPSQADPDFMSSRTIHNPDKKGLSVRWKGNQQMEDFRVSLREGGRLSSYFIVRYVGPEMPTFIMQTGIGYAAIGDFDEHYIDTDLDGRPPSAGEIAQFIVPLANEVKNKSLVEMTA